jgi:hypothetical protein
MVDSLEQIDFTSLKDHGIKGLMLDLDNTLITSAKRQMGENVYQWLTALAAMEFQVMIVSNNRLSRVKDIAGQWSIPFVANACKPVSGGFLKALNLMRLEPHQVAIIGDQLFTDILGGNWLGLYTILVQPLSPQEFFGTKIQRPLERWVIRRLRAQGKI